MRHRCVIGVHLYKYGLWRRREGGRRKRGRGVRTERSDDNTASAQADARVHTSAHPYIHACEHRHASTHPHTSINTHCAQQCLCACVHACERTRTFVAKDSACKQRAPLRHRFLGIVRAHSAIIVAVVVAAHRSPLLLLLQSFFKLVWSCAPRFVNPSMYETSSVNV